MSFPVNSTTLQITAKLPVVPTVLSILALVVSSFALYLQFIVGHSIKLRIIRKRSESESEGKIIGADFYCYISNTGSREGILSDIKVDEIRTKINGMKIIRGGVNGLTFPSRVRNSSSEPIALSINYGEPLTKEEANSLRIKLSYAVETRRGGFRQKFATHPN